jgi:hypothetical protein
MNVSYQIAGYDKRTEQLVREYQVPADTLPAVMQAAHVSLEQAAGFGSIPLEAAVVRKIGHQLNKSIYSDFCDWFLEPFALPDRA